MARTATYPRGAANGILVLLLALLCRLLLVGLQNGREHFLVCARALRVLLGPLQLRVRPAELDLTVRKHHNAVDAREVLHCRVATDECY